MYTHQLCEPGIISNASNNPKIDAGPDKYTIKCKQNPQAVCYEYNTDDNWIRLCDGSGTMIGYVTSVEYMGNYEDPSTGDIIDIYEVQTGTD